LSYGPRTCVLAEGRIMPQSFSAKWFLQIRKSRRQGTGWYGCLWSTLPLLPRTWPPH